MTDKQKRCIEKLRNYFDNQEEIAYNNMLNKITTDAKFEKMIQAVTVDRLIGGASHEKYTFRWDKR